MLLLSVEQPSPTRMVPRELNKVISISELMMFTDGQALQTEANYTLADDGLVPFVHHHQMGSHGAPETPT
jgi:hypothetical protein